MFYTIYKTINLINGKIYIGQHITSNLDDGYMGSGTYFQSAINAYDPENFKKEILYIFNSKKEMDDKEREIVNEDFIIREDNYNLVVGGNGGNKLPSHHWTHSKENMEKMQIARLKMIKNDEEFKITGLLSVERED